MKTKTVYIADDGKEFINQEACKDWEKSKELRESISRAWYHRPDIQHEWIFKVALELVKEYHIVKRSESKQIPSYLNKSGETPD